MTRPRTPSGGSTLRDNWWRWRSLIERGLSAVGGNLFARAGDRPTGLSPAIRDRVIGLIVGDLDCLIDDAKDKDVSEQAVEEMLRNRELLIWLRGGPLPGQGAVELLEDNVTIFYRVSADDEQANGDALRATLNALVHAQEATEEPDDRCKRNAEAAGLTERERRRFGQRLDELRQARNMKIGDLAARSGIDVVAIVALIHGAEEAGALEMMQLAAALEAVPRELFPDWPDAAEVGDPPWVKRAMKDPKEGGGK